MSKPRRNERRSAREVKRSTAEILDFSLFLSADETAAPAKETYGATLVYVDAKTPEPLHVDAMSKENEGN